MHRRTIISYFIFLSFSIVSMAQSPRELLMIARDANSGLKALETEYRSALEKATQISQLPNPEIGAGGFLSPVETRLGGQKIRLSATQMFPWFGSFQAKEDWAIAEAKAGYAKIASQELELYYKIQQAYFKLYELHNSIALLEDNIVLLNSLKSIAETKVMAGKASLADVLRIELKLEDHRQQLNILASQKRKPLAQINQILNRPLDSSIRLPDSLDFASLPFQKDSLLTSIHSQHPMLEMFSLQQEAAQKAILVNEKAAKPSFGLGMDYILVDGRTDAFPTNNGRDIFQLRASISVPLYRKKYAAKEREENLRIEALENRKQEVETFFFSMVEQAYADYEIADYLQQLYAQQIKTTKATIRILLVEYSNQSKSFDELLQLEEKLVEYDLKLLQTFVQSHIVRAKIERYLPQ